LKSFADNVNNISTLLEYQMLHPRRKLSRWTRKQASIIDSPETTPYLSFSAKARAHMIIKNRTL
jgi:hypothetical protein